METEPDVKEEAPPGPNDLPGWRRVIDEGRLPGIKREDLVATIQDLGPHANPQVLNPMLRELSDHAWKTLRKCVGTNHPNQGNDVIERAHFAFIQALYDPTSADGKGFRQAYYSRLSYRLKDAIGKEIRSRRSEDDILEARAKKAQERLGMHKAKTAIENHAKEDDEDEDPGDEGDLAMLEVSRLGRAGTDFGEQDDSGPTKAEYEAGLMDGVNAMQGQIYVDQLLNRCVHDERKRLAFRLHMEQISAKSKKTISIASVLGIDGSTARAWIKEVAEILKEKMEGNDD